MKSVKMKRVHKLLKNELINAAFRKMVGVEDIDPNIIEGKYDKMMETLRSFLNILLNLLRSGILDILSDIINSSASEQLSIFIQESIQEIKDFKLNDHTKKYISDLTHINSKLEEGTRKKLLEQIMSSRYDKEQLKTAYNAMIDSEVFKQCINTCNTFANYLKMDKIAYNKEQHDFATSDCAWSFIISCNTPCYLFTFCRIDFRQIFICHSLDDETKRYILKTLYMVFTKCKKLLDIYCIPNVNAEEYMSAIKAAIETFRKQIPRCDAAFNKMIQLLDRFEEKYPKYYKSYVMSGNPYIILESYFKDVARQYADSGTDINLKYQFNKIIKHITQQNKEMLKTNPDSSLAKTLDIIDTLKLDESDEDQYDSSSDN